MHERFVGSLTTAGVRDGPTETCLQLHWSNILGVARPPAQKENQFSPKNGHELPILCRKQCFFGIHYALCAMLNSLREPDAQTLRVVGPVAIVLCFHYHWWFL